MYTLRSLSAAALTALLVLPGRVAADLKIARNTARLEWTPELIAQEDYFNGSATFVDGGLGSLVASDPASAVDLAGGDETELLLQYARHRNLRTLVTTVEAYYRIVASRKAGIAEVADLKGKRIGAIKGTSAEYFVRKFLASEAGLSPADYTVVGGMACLASPCAANSFPVLLQQGTIDAIAMWEPTVQLGIEALGGADVDGDAIILGVDQSVYRSIYSLVTTTEKLADPAKRAEMVQFLAAMIKSEDVFRSQPGTVLARAAAAMGANVSTALFESVYDTLRWTAQNNLDLDAVLIAEEGDYVSALQNRTAMADDVVAAVVDASVLYDAFASL